METELQTSKMIQKSEETFWRVVNAILASEGQKPTMLTSFPPKGTPRTMADDIINQRNLSLGG